MFLIILTALFVIMAVAAFILPSKVMKTTEFSHNGPTTVTNPSAKYVSLILTPLFLFFAGVTMLATSYTNISKDGVGLLDRVYLGKPLPEGRVIAFDGELGPQARYITPGFQLSWFINVLHDIEEVPITVVPDGKYAKLEARDGKIMPEGMTYAPIWDVEDVSTMLDVETFMENGGYKGPQATTLPPGPYRINTYFWKVTYADALEVPKGQVALIKSNVSTRVSYNNLKADRPETCQALDLDSNGVRDLTTPIVPVGCPGVWEKALNPGKYYLHNGAFIAKTIPVELKAWEYAGGFVSRFVGLSVDEKGKITQDAGSDKIEIPEGAAGSAINIKVDGYPIWLSARALVQVTPEDAPFVYAAVGSLQEVEDNVISPLIASQIRSLSGRIIDVEEPVIDDETGRPVVDENGDVVTRTVRRPLQPLDLIERREELEDVVEGIVIPEAAKHGVTIREIRFLEPDIPPEVLIPRKRRQLANEMKSTLRQEQEAQRQRIAVEAASAEADQQDVLIASEIAKKAAENRGKGERAYLEEVAQGERARVEVIGADRAFMLSALKEILNKLGEHPELASYIPKMVPSVVVSGDGGGLSGLAGILSNTPLFQQGMKSDTGENRKQ